tara:strand:- start:84174 stop:84437 length:264 start_codon:yes stop_codon:yes gene_type:complete
MLDENLLMKECSGRKLSDVKKSSMSNSLFTSFSFVSSSANEKIIEIFTSSSIAVTIMVGTNNKDRKIPKNAKAMFLYVLLSNINLKI